MKNVKRNKERQREKKMMSVRTSTEKEKPGIDKKKKFKNTIHIFIGKYSIPTKSLFYSNQR